MAANEDDRDLTARVRPSRSRFRHMLRSKDGATAVEFALLAIPYFIIVFAIIETFVAYTAEQLVTNAVDTLGRQLRTGQITYNLGLSTDKNVTDFRKAFCDEIAIMIKCSATEAATPSSLWLDVESYTSFANMPTTIPRVDANDPHADLATTGFKYAPGGSGSINMLRAFYRWQVITDIVRPYVSTINPSDGSLPNTFLIVATAAFKNESYNP
jgi:Flp pilus assembly protein TadG